MDAVDCTTIEPLTDMLIVYSYSWCGGLESIVLEALYTTRPNVISYVPAGRARRSIGLMTVRSGA